MSYSIECVLESANHVGEGPIWDTEEGVLYWIDNSGQRVGKPNIWRYDPRTGKADNWHLDRDIGALALRNGGGAVLALDDGFYFFDFKTSKAELISHLGGGQTRLRLNDGKCDRHGRFFAGEMDDKEELKIGRLWRLDPDLSVHKVDEGIICSNGPCWAPDDKTFYFADTFQDEIWAYDYDVEAGTVSNRRVFANTKVNGGVPDGSTVDAEGYVWNAHLIAGDLVRYAPDGSVERRIGMPVRNVTSVNFGGPNLDEIYVVTMGRVKHPAVHSRFRVETKPQFGAGNLFRIRGLGIHGVAEPRFAG